jgi:hypothetical protein
MHVGRGSHQPGPPRQPCGAPRCPSSTTAPWRWSCCVSGLLSWSTLQHPMGCVSLGMETLGKGEHSRHLWSSCPPMWAAHAPASRMPPGTPALLWPAARRWLAPHGLGGCGCSLGRRGRRPRGSGETGTRRPSWTDREGDSEAGWAGTEGGTMERSANDMRPCLYRLESRHVAWGGWVKTKAGWPAMRLSRASAEHQRRYTPHSHAALCITVMQQSGQERDGVGLRWTDAHIDARLHHMLDVIPSTIHHLPRRHHKEPSCRHHHTPISLQTIM